MKNFIEVSQISDIRNPIFLDVRTSLTDSEFGITEYRKGHIEGAYFLDLEQDLSGKTSAETGNHPLPALEDFRKSIEKTGADENSTFLIYDAGDNFTAGRALFVLRYFGLKNAYIVNGGLKAMTDAGMKTVTEDTPEKKGNLSLTENKDLLADFDEVKRHSENPEENKVLIDSRGHDRYLGNNETLYDRAGHIPGAKSYFFGDNYENGKVRDEKFLKERFKDLEGKEVIVSCGSGVTACSNLVAMEEAGLKPRVFIGSYSQWIKKGEPVKTEEE